MRLLRYQPKNRFLTLMVRDRGSVLLLGVVISLLFLLMTLGAINMAMTLGKEANYELDLTRSLSVAEGVTESAQKSILETVSNFGPVPTTGTVNVAGQAYAYTVVPIGASTVQTDPDGVSRTMQHLQISANVNAGDGYSTVDRIVDLSLTPLFQYMIFFDDDLEVLPGPPMTLGGRVHANADIYVGSGDTLTVNSDYFRCTGKILRQRKNDNTTATGTVSIKVLGETTYQNLNVGQDSNYTDWTTHAIDTWKGTVQDGSHGVKEIAAPDIHTIKAFQAGGAKGFYHANADLVLVDGNAFDKLGNPLALPVGTVTQKPMFDGREGKNITVTEVNMALLNASGAFPTNGLLYAYRTDATSAQPNGVRLTNGAELLRPLTVVSEDQVYVHGDFNTVNKKGASVIADAVSLLSNAWNNTKTSASGLPAASNTTYNLAFVSGATPTPDGGGSYSGGFENLPRFHENWTNKTAKIRGSFIKIFDSEIAKAPWAYGGSVYTAPIRDWQYDPALNDMANLPPFTPSAVYFERVLWDDRIPMPFN